MYSRETYGTMKNAQSRETGNIVYTRHKTKTNKTNNTTIHKTKTKNHNNTIVVGHHWMQENTNKVNKT